VGGAGEGEGGGGGGEVRAPRAKSERASSLWKPWRTTGRSPTGLPWGASSFLWPEPDRRVGALKIVTQTQIPVPFLPPNAS
jgi:hypothetical protein